MDHKEKQPSYLKLLMRFYFKPAWPSVLTVSYLLFFGYFSLFYIGNIWVAIKFIFYTLFNSAHLLGLSYLLWGVLFIIGLIVPFFASLYSIILLYEIWDEAWKKRKKILLSALLSIATLLLILIIDSLVRLVASQDVLTEFVVRNSLRVTGL